METCVPEGDTGMTIRKMMSMTLAVDHKVANGAYAAQFLELVKKMLEDTATFWRVVSSHYRFFAHGSGAFSMRQRTI